MSSDFADFIETAVTTGDTKNAQRRWRHQYKDQRLDGWTALHYACRYAGGDRGDLVRLLVSLGCDTEAQSDHDGGRRPLHICAIYDSLEAMRALLEAGCSLSCVDEAGETPLMVADWTGHQACSSLLRSALEQEKLIELLKTNSLSKIMDPETGKTLLDQILSTENKKVIDAAKAKQVDAQEIIDWKELLMNASDINPQSLLSLHECLIYRCINQQYPNGVYSLCKAKIVNKNSLFMGPTALETAVECGFEAWVHEILNKLVDIDESWSRAEDIAKRGDQRHILEMILKRKEYLDRKKKKGISRLHIAVVENDPDMIKYLLNRGTLDANEYQGNIGSALGLAYHVDHMDMSESLLSNASSSNEWITRDHIMDVLNDGETPLAKVMYDHATPQLKADVLETMLHTAVINGDKDLFKATINDGISPDSSLEGRESLLTSLIKEGKVDFVRLVLSSTNGPWFADKKNLDSQLPLHVCIESGLWEVLDRLIAETVSVNEEDVHGSTPLSLLLSRMSETEDDILTDRLTTFVKLLISKSADIYLVNQLGRTAISYCTRADLRLEVETYHHRQQFRLATAGSLQVPPSQDGAQANICPICEEQPLNCGLNCGHVFCKVCVQKTVDCYICRAKITNAFQLFL